MALTEQQLREIATGMDAAGFYPADVADVETAEALWAHAVSAIESTGTPEGVYPEPDEITDAEVAARVADAFAVLYGLKTATS